MSEPITLKALAGIMGDDGACVCDVLEGGMPPQDMLLFVKAAQALAVATSLHRRDYCGCGKCKAIRALTEAGYLP